MSEYLPYEVFSRLPDLIYNVFSHLPVESLFRFRCVCRKWRAIIDDPLLIEMHTHQFMLGKQSNSDCSSVSFLLLSRFHDQFFGFHEFHFGEYFDEDGLSSSSRCYKVTKPIKYINFGKDIVVGHSWNHRISTIVGSCNGLVCIAVAEEYEMPNVLYVFNPVTKEYLRIPRCDKYKNLNEFGYLPSTNGFGYLSSTKEYKVVKIICNGPREEHVEVYTLGTGEWRSIRCISPIFRHLVRSSGVLVNEALHWIVSNGKIASFNLATEKFRMVSSPSPLALVPRDAHSYELGVMGGRSLCVIKHNICKSVDIWVKDNNIEEGSWTKKFIVPLRKEVEDDVWEKAEDYNFVTITKNGKVLLWHNGTSLVSYDPKTEEFTSHGDYKADPFWCEAAVHRKSFVSLKALGEDSLIMAETEVRN